MKPSLALVYVFHSEGIGLFCCSVLSVHATTVFSTTSANATNNKNFILLILLILVKQIYNFILLIINSKVFRLAEEILRYSFGKCSDIQMVRSFGNILCFSVFH